MTPFDLQRLEELNEEFEKECKRVAEKLEAVDDVRKEPMGISFADEFELYKGRVCWYGREPNYCGGDPVSGNFDAKLLSMTDGELDEHIKFLVKQTEKEELEKEEKKRQDEIQHKKNMMQRLLEQAEKLKQELDDE